MGMDASILAIGPFRREIIPALPYSTSHYADTRPGVRVIAADLFQVGGSDASRRLAECLGITDPWDFNQHPIDPAKVDLDAIRSRTKGTLLIIYEFPISFIDRILLGFVSHKISSVPFYSV